MNNADVYQAVTDRIIASLENGVAPWRKPWKARVRHAVKGARFAGPLNMDGRPYRGINYWLLCIEAMEHGYSSPFWMTFKRAKDLGGHVKKGEKSTVIIFWKKITITEKDDDGKPVKKQIPMARYYRVFNLEQTEGVKVPAKLQVTTAPESEPEPFTEPEMIEAADAILAGFKDAPPISYGGDRAFYSPGRDAIVVPARDAYDGPGEFYSTLFHEIGHSTGHEKRCNRWADKNKEQFHFGSHPYGREELVAEMTAAYLTTLAGIETTQENSAAYLNSWIKSIKEDPKALIWAAGRAQMAADHILGITFEDESESEEETTQGRLVAA